MNILAIETSCDETAAAVIENGRICHSSVVLSQISEHKLYGGVVPEIASRRHVENIENVVEQALKDATMTLKNIDAIGVTAGPGLIGALLVGVNFGKSLAYSMGIPLVPVHHIRGHVASNFLAHPGLEPPFLSLVVSGGHSHIIEVLGYTSYKVLGYSLDDAAGEAFDKVARTLGFPYPGGIYIDRAAEKGDPFFYKLPTPHSDGEYNFSFSGLKTAVINLVHNLEQKGETIEKDHLAASFQQVVVSMLVNNLTKAGRNLGYSKIAVAGGVSANSGLRKALAMASEKEGFQLFIPPLSLTGDNAAMIGSQAFYEYQAGATGGPQLNAYAGLSLEHPF